jgi:hypothetical protein
MGRDNADSTPFLRGIHPRTRIPSNNIILVGILILIGALRLPIHSVPNCSTSGH